MNTKENSADTLEDRVVKISRVAKVVKGGRRFSFSALVVVGDGKSKVGYGVGKAQEVPDAIRKAADHAKKNLKTIYHVNGTIPFAVDGEFSSTQVRMYPAKSGKGIIAGGAVRTVVELSGLKDIVCKIHGSKNGHTVVRATIDGLNQLMSMENYAKQRGFKVEEIFEASSKPKETE